MLLQGLCRLLHFVGLNCTLRMVPVCRCIQNNYSRIKDVERELSGLQMQLKLSTGPKRSALMMLRKKIELQNERVLAARERQKTAKKVCTSPLPYTTFGYKPCFQLMHGLHHCAAPHSYKFHIRMPDCQCQDICSHMY